MLDRVDLRTLQLEAFRTDVMAGLAQTQKTLPSRWLYDDRGSQLFEEITHLEQYYPTRTETGILREHAGPIAAFVGAGAVLFEYGAGAGIKTEILIDALQAPRLYVPIDIAGDFLDQTIERMRARYPQLETRGVIADFTTDFDLPADLPRTRRAGFFPGSTIGNLDETETLAFLRRMRRHVGRRGSAVVGADLKKDLPTLLAAYDDRAGVTAAFNLNLLARVNRELDGEFPLDRFAHEARWNAGESAVEMHLVSLDARTVEVDGQCFAFAAGESIHTESSRKYDERTVADLAARSGWRVAACWSDAGNRFAVFGLEAAA
ncbi:MAG TPA: L-histidine N(alpha)-methyltransferase [Dokdonella sp.]